MWPLPLTLLLLAQSPVSGPWLEAVQRARVAKDARVELVRVDAVERGCQPTSVESPPVTSSGRLSLRPRGPGCEKWVWAEVRVHVPGLRAKRALKPGERIDEDAVSVEWIEMRRGRRPLGALPEEAHARTHVRAGELLEVPDVTARPAANTPVTIVFERGGLMLEQAGRIVDCSGGGACATLPNGRRVRGTYRAQRLYLEEP